MAKTHKVAPFRYLPDKEESRLWEQAGREIGETGDKNYLCDYVGINRTSPGKEVPHARLQLFKPAWIEDTWQIWWEGEDRALACCFLYWMSRTKDAM